MAELKKVEIRAQSYALTLNQAEADALTQALAAVGGNPRSSRRGLIDPIFDLLVANGGQWYPQGDMRRDITGSIQFDGKAEPAATYPYPLTQEGTP